MDARLTVPDAQGAGVVLRHVPGRRPAGRAGRRYRLAKQSRDDDRLRRADDPAPEPLFAGANDDEAGTVADDSKARVSDADLAAVIARIRASFARSAGADQRVAIEPVRGMADLPPALQAAERRKQLDLGKGVFYDNVV